MGTVEQIQSSAPLHSAVSWRATGYRLALNCLQYLDYAKHQAVDLIVWGHFWGHCAKFSYLFFIFFYLRT